MVSCQEYWNNIEIEKNKAYWLESDDDPRLINYLRDETNLEKCFYAVIDYVKTKYGGIRGDVLDVAAGVGWTSAILSKLPEVSSITAIDCSKHRIELIAPIVFRQLGGNITKYVSIIDDFMRADFKGRKFNAILFCQALYMFPDLRRALNKVNELLLPGGLLIVAAERITYPYSPFTIPAIKEYIKNILGRKRADESGNNRYTDWEYERSIKRAGFKYDYQQLSFPILPHDSKLKCLMAANYIGIKY